ncbi:MAG: NAD(P)/FAD-dependent oxidoreductase [Pseudomonadota bacterium]
MKRVAVIGSGISGLGAAWELAREARETGLKVTLFEADGRFGGHAHTVDVTLDGVTHGVDTGFLVFNERTYPHLIRLFAELGVQTAPSDMSFSVQAVDAGLEWSGSSLATVFAQRRNLLRPAFWRMLRELLRFNALATRLATEGSDMELAQPVGDFLHQQGFGTAFRDWYLLPMVACIWSCPTQQMLRFPVGTLIRFCHNHGLIQVNGRPQWYTVAGGSRHYVEKIVAALGDARAATPVRGLRRLPGGVDVLTDAGSERFDEVVLACHSDQALRLLGAQASAEEREVLGAIRYHDNQAVLHTDTALLPRRRRAWAAWNYERAAQPGREGAAVCLHYLINRLQPLPWQQPVIVSLNPVREPHPDAVIRRIAYAHPVFDLAAIRAQRRIAALQGRQRTWFCGAWTGYGFHEDGLRSAMAVVRGLRRTALADEPQEAAA